MVACKLYPQGATTNSAQGVCLQHTTEDSTSTITSTSPGSPSIVDNEASVVVCEQHPLSPLTPVLEAMAVLGMPLLVHGEVADPAVDIFDRERVFLETVLMPLRRQLPSLKVGGGD